MFATVFPLESSELKEKEGIVIILSFLLGRQFQMQASFAGVMAAMGLGHFTKFTREVLVALNAPWGG